MNHSSKYARNRLKRKKTKKISYKIKNKKIKNKKIKHKKIKHKKTKKRSYKIKQKNKKKYKKRSGGGPFDKSITRMRALEAAEQPRTPAQKNQKRSNDYISYAKVKYDKAEALFGERKYEEAKNTFLGASILYNSAKNAAPLNEKNYKMAEKTINRAKDAEERLKEEVEVLKELR